MSDTPAPLAVFDNFTIPVWVFDIDHSRVVWANAPALRAWNADSLEELRARDMSVDMSPSVRQSFRQYQEDFALGRSFVLPWTLYPLDQPQTFQCHFSGYEIEPGRFALLCQALYRSGSTDGDIGHGIQAMLLTSAMVSIYDLDGRLIYANPAARATLGAGIDTLGQRFIGERDLKAIRAGIDATGEYRGELEVNTVDGTAWHEVSVQLGPDANTGKQVYLFSEFNIHERRAAQEQVAYLAYHDSLTGLANRTQLIEQLKRELHHVAGSEQEFALLFLDLDRFKNINDTLGHALGDCLLLQVAERVRTSVMDCDTVARLGGDEFVCILRGREDAAAVRDAAAAILAAIAKPVDIEPHELFVTASIGIGLYPGDGKSASRLMQHADIAMYRAKSDGGNTAVFFDADMNREFEARLTLEAELREAIQLGQFELYYQPRIDFASQRVNAAEALLRWRHPRRGLLAAGEFIEVAEESGMLAEIDDWVLQEAVCQQVSWRNEGLELGISVNVSTRQFASENFAAKVRDALACSGCRPQDLELEITESVYMGSEPSVEKLLDELKQIGVIIAVDDFGTGYSNLAYLQNFPIDCLKIDQSFVRQDDNRNILAWIIALGQLLGVNLVAEGVETPEQAEWLHQQGCSHFQGYYFARPLTPVALSEFAVGFQPLPAVANRA